MTPLEIWGGVECTVNRVRDRWHSQLARSGHSRRSADMDLIADLGIRTVRYPVLWESLAPESPAHIDWSWPDERLAMLRERNITPIVGLLHHGSGPRYTSLADPGFARGLAEFATRVADRYPWLEYFTPVNEPLTTARFSALYGHWYPHLRDDSALARTMVNQCRGIVLSMQAIRQIIPHAQLVQTEDLGTTFGTAHMAYQTRFDNERRWLTWDILCGRVDEQHPLTDFLLHRQIDEHELDWFIENTCPPQILGINHYVTSDRFLDERTTLYPPTARGCNGREKYADMEAVRVLRHDYGGWDIIERAWERYHVPVALTEVHLGCTREEQLRWFHGAWLAAHRARVAGCDVRALTAWSLFGSFDWESLLTRFDGRYEPGAYDVRAPLPRPTAIANLVRRTISAGRPLHPVLASPGWWQRPDKVIYGDASPVTATGWHSRPGIANARNPRPILICGAGGALGHALRLACIGRNLAICAVGRRELDICDPRAVDELMRATQPWAVINAAGFVDVDLAELETGRCFRENVLGVELLAAAARKYAAQLLTFSTDLVFDGNTIQPYNETARVCPLGTYGRCKAAAEEHALGGPNSLCVRSAAFFGASGRDDFLAHVLRTLARGERFAAVDDVMISPTYLPDLASASLDLLIDECVGLIHLTNDGMTSWADFARSAAAAMQLDVKRIEGRPQHSFNLPASRPVFSALTSERVRIMPTLADAMARYAESAISAESRLRTRTG